MGRWVCLPDCHDWYWEGTCRTLYGGWIGNPFEGYRLEPKPTQPCGAASVPPLPPPPAQTPPPPPPPASGPPVEIPPPAAGKITGDDRETAPPCKPGSSMATLDAAHMEYHYGFNQEEHTDWPGIGKFLSVNKYASLSTVPGEDLIKQTRPTFTNYAYKEKDADGNLRVLHPATGPGEVWLSPPELEDYNLGGDLSAYTGKLPGGNLPRSISRVGLNIASFRRLNPDTGVEEDAAKGYIGLGVYHPTGTYVADGFIAELTGAAGARNLLLQATNYSGALDSSCSKKVVIQNALEVGCDLTVNGSIIEAGTTEEISTSTSDLGSFSAISCGSESAMFEYEVIGWNDVDGETIAAHGRIVTEAGALLDTLQKEHTHVGAVTVTVAAGSITVSVTNTRTATDTTCWTLKYRLTLRGAC